MISSQIDLEVLEFFTSKCPLRDVLKHVWRAQCMMASLTPEEAAKRSMVGYCARNTLPYAWRLVRRIENYFTCYDLEIHIPTIEQGVTLKYPAIMFTNARASKQSSLNIDSLLTPTMQYHVQDVLWWAPLTLMAHDPETLLQVQASVRAVTEDLQEVFKGFLTHAEVQDAMVLNMPVNGMWNRTPEDPTPLQLLSDTIA